MLQSPEGVLGDDTRAGCKPAGVDLSAPAADTLTPYTRLRAAPLARLRGITWRALLAPSTGLSV